MNTVPLADVLALASALHAALDTPPSTDPQQLRDRLSYTRGVLSGIGIDYGALDAARALGRVAAGEVPGV